MKYISHHPNKDNPTSYYVRILKPDRTLLSRCFLFSSQEEQARALVDAKLWRTKMLHELWGECGLLKNSCVVSPSVNRKQRVYRTGRSNCSSGHLGVSLNIKESRNGGILKRWVAIWREDGRVRTKSFSFEGVIGPAKNRSSDEALELAIAYREKMVKKYYLAT